MLENKGLLTLVKQQNKFKLYQEAQDFFEKVKKMSGDMGLTFITAKQKQRCEHQRAYSFHENAPMYCPDCNEYV